MIIKVVNYYLEQLFHNHSCLLSATILFQLIYIIYFNIDNHHIENICL